MIFEVILIFIGLLMSFSAVLISSFAKPSEKQKFSFLATVSALIYFIISFLNIYSDTVDQFIIYQKFTFTAGIYMMIGFGFALSYMFDITYSNKTKLAIIIASLEIEKRDIINSKKRDKEDINIRQVPNILK